MSRILDGGENSKCQPSWNSSDCCDSRNKGSTPTWLRVQENTPKIVAI